MDELLANFKKGVTASDAEIEAWGKLKPATWDQAEELAELGDFNFTSHISVGLFSFELTKFLADCAQTEYCNVLDYDAFSGWAIGVNWETGTVKQVDGVFFN